jgi:hypothetical protein
MPTMTLSVPNDLYTVIKHYEEIKWSVIARNAMWEYARKIQLVDSILEKSELTEEDAAQIGRLIKKSIREKHDIEWVGKMRLVIDTNIIISSLISNSARRHILMNSNIEFISPEYTFAEIFKHTDLIKKKGKL